MRKILLAMVSVAPLLGGPALAADGPDLGTVLKDAAGQAAKDTIDKTVKPSDRDRDYRDRDRDRKDGDRKDRDRKDKDRKDGDRKDKDRGYRDRGDAPGKSYEHRRDGRGLEDNPGRGRGKDRD
ncbi:Prostatic spermine-binding protein precursor [Magnetospirillum sp. SS-4]|uniref:Prostatic spermine-binding protein precursor n=1 Tax=Magnetospirillum sp. SS-4 TaxID=2681465 RepID=UPI00137F9242|nr:Prostatic spermine-binding protein precursor [Magnetospirillum sp. SS-4]CAA7617900.1 Prostatic spermine-binding protein [Magnetospirillum sp. SS-4]